MKNFLNKKIKEYLLTTLWSMFLVFTIATDIYLVRVVAIVLLSIAAFQSAKDAYKGYMLAQNLDDISVAMDEMDELIKKLEDAKNDSRE